MRGPLTFRQKDLTRAIRAALAAGLVVERAWIEVDGRIVLGFANGKPVVPDHEQDTGNDWDGIADGKHAA